MNQNRQDSNFFKNVANADFEVAVRRGFWRSVTNWLQQKDNRLLPFDEIRRFLPTHGQYDAGMHEIPIRNIVGSVARYNDFDQAFLPRQRHTKSRWVSIDMANLQDVILPPIEVYKIGELYFVKDGNHRVSVAKEKGQAFIDAQVIEIVTPHPITNMDNIFDIILEQERLDFYAKTSIDAIRPNSGLELTIPGQYEKLLEHISVHRWFMGERKRCGISDAEAVAGWYDEVYLPLAGVIEAQKTLKDFPGRTVTDLYLWIIEHLWFLREQYQEEISLEQAVSHFKRLFSRKPFKRINTLLHKLADIIIDAPAVEPGTLADVPQVDFDENRTGGDHSEIQDGPS